MPDNEIRLDAQGEREPPTETQWRNLARSARAAGKPQNLRLPRRTTRLLGAGGQAKPYRRADWIGKLAKDRAPARDVLDHLTRRLERAPTREALVEAGLLLEELSRSEDGQAEVSRRLTQEAVGPLLGKRG